MDAASLIERLVSLERAAGAAGKTQMHDFVIEAQDCVLRMQEEILHLRRENLRLLGAPEQFRRTVTGEELPAPDTVSPSSFAA